MSNRTQDDRLISKRSAHKTELSDEQKRNFAHREFELMDTNRNGTIDPKEFQAYVDLKVVSQSYSFLVLIKN